MKTKYYFSLENSIHVVNTECHNILLSALLVRDIRKYLSIYVVYLYLYCTIHNGEKRTLLRLGKGLRHRGGHCSLCSRCPSPFSFYCVQSVTLWETRETKPRLLWSLLAHSLIVSISSPSFWLWIYFNVIPLPTTTISTEHFEVLNITITIILLQMRHHDVRSRIRIL